jgi:tRNA-intron endonuclease, archaea type
MIKAQLLADKIYSNSTDAFTLYDKSRLGEKRRTKIEYSFVETLFLLHEKKLQVFRNNKSMDFDQLLKKAKTLDKRIEIKLPVFTTLRKRGYIVKTALKFGAEFRIYNKGIKPGQDHALWICFPIKESEKHSWYDFAAKNRVAHAAKKKLLIAIVDDEDDVTFYEVGWLKP